jgi:hypothetical protein
MVIGELKRKMNERDGLVIPTDLKGFAKDFNTPEGSTIKRNKSKQAYQILTSMDIEWDNIKMKWYKKEWL